MELAATKAIITGGASGLGNAVARHLAAAGARLALFDVNQEQGQLEAQAIGNGAVFHQVDVTDEQAVSEHVGAATKEMGGLNCLVNCAGILGAGRVLGREGPMPLDRFRATVLVNLVGSFNVAKAAAEQMQQGEAGEDGERGVIINTASVAAFEGQIGQAAYSASKGGVVGMTLPMARELARFGIRVATIAPGIFWTPMVDGMPEEVQQSLSESIPFPSRLGQANEYADTVAYILGNRYLNGTTIRLDGAVRLAAK